MGQARPDDHFLDEVCAHIDEWHASAKRTKDLEEKAREDPRTYASLALDFIRSRRRHIRRLLRKRFGVKVRYFGFRSEQYVACRDRFPRYPSRHPQDYYNYVQFRVMSNLLRGLDVQWAVMHSAYIKAYRSGEDPDVAALAALFSLSRSGPIGATPTIETEPDDVLREMQAKQIAGWVGSHISLDLNKSLSAVLGERTGGSRGANFVELMKNLVPATVVAWADLQPGEPLRPGSGETNLVSRAERLLINEGSEAARLERKGKFADLAASPGSDRKGEGLEDADLEEFERQETLRQQLSALQGWIERAGFSEQEQRVYELDMRMGEDAQAIARELGKSDGHVRVVRKNYRDKIRRAAGL
jgi:hypothetical protein